jgi:hypothetical protein
MTININNATYGQHPYFDNSTPDFEPIGSSYLTDRTEPPTLSSSGKAILYDSSIGDSRSKACLRRYSYQYNINTNIFTYYKTYKGVRNFEQPDSVIDITELNARSLIHSTEIIGSSAPSFIDQNILQTLFKFPSHNDYFFVEGSHYYQKGADEDNGGSDRNNFFKIYRYGKITSNNIILIYKNNNESRRS